MGGGRSRERTGGRVKGTVSPGNLPPPEAAGLASDWEEEEGGRGEGGELGIEPSFLSSSSPSPSSSSSPSPSPSPSSSPALSPGRRPS